MIIGAVAPDSRYLDHHRAHGDGVVDLALEVPDVDKCIAQARSCGATILDEPHDISDEHGTVRLAAIATYGETRHTLVDRSRYDGVYLPGFVERTSTMAGPDRRLFQAIDHCVGNVELGRMDDWVDFYNRVMGFVNMAEFVGDDIATDYSALMSKVVASGNHRVKFPLNEPAARPEARVADRRVPGVLRRPGRASTWRWRRNGHPDVRPWTSCGPAASSSWPTPDSYYDRPGAACRRIGAVRVPTGELKARGILVDRDEDGYLLQIFTKPVGDRPTVFYRVHRAARVAGLRQGQLPGAVRGDRAGAGATGQSLRPDGRRKLQGRPDGRRSPSCRCTYGGACSFSR